MLVLQSLRGLSLEATEKMVRDRPGWMRFCGLEMCDRVPDANTLWDFREALIKAGALMICSRNWTRRSTRPAAFPDPARSWTRRWTVRAEPHRVRKCEATIRAEWFGNAASGSVRA